MADALDSGEQAVFHRGRILGVLLQSAGILLAIVVAVWTVDRLAALSRRPDVSSSDYVLTLLVLFGGWAASLLVVGLSELIRGLDRLASLVERGEPAPAPTLSPGTTTSGGGLNDEMVALVRELRDISLLSPEERAQRLQAQGAELLRQAQREVPELLREHNWIEARRRVLSARSRFPNIPQWDVLAAQIEQVRAQVESQDIESAGRQIEDLLALGAWERAMEVVREMQLRHPEAPGAATLLKRVRQHRDKAEAEQRAKLMAQAQEAAHLRDWVATLHATSAFIQRFPDSPEAQRLRLDLPMLRANAEVQTRQRLESQIRQFVKERRFREALASARSVIAEYPTSPQAEALREQIPKLEAMARK
ncbi:MAG: hypothetical protein U1D55_18165 [Phycisphaerae bacterium]